MIDLGLNQITVDAAKLVGYNDILGRTIGRILYGRLKDILDDMVSSAVLIIDFVHLDQADASTLAISVVKTAALALRSSEFYKVAVCANTTKTHREQLNEAVAVWAELQDPWREKPRSRLLLLVSDRGYPMNWFLLGGEDLAMAEKAVWTKLTESGCVSLNTLMVSLNSSGERLRSYLDVFIQNRVASIVEHESRSMICSLLTHFSDFDFGDT